jgi:phage portal protein BeeE
VALSSLIPAAFRRSVTESAAGPGWTQLPPRAGYLPGVPAGGINETTQAMGASTGTDRRTLMQDLNDVYLTCPWIWTCVQVIARTITAGGLTSDWDADTGEGDQKEPQKPPAVVALERFYAFCNPTQDIIQILRNTIADLLVFGDAMLEICWSGPIPVAIYNQDVATTYPDADEHGVIRKYVQVTDYGQRAEFEPREIIHISLDSARPGMFGVSPAQAMLGPAAAWLFAHATVKEMLRKGLPPTVHADLPASKSETETERWRNQAASQNLGSRNIGNPWITRGGGTLTELQAGKLADALAAKADSRDEIVAGMGVPPAEAGIIESGNLGGGTGDSQHRGFMLNTCNPLAAVVLEKLNFHIAVQGFGVQDWHSKFGEVDYRDSAVVETIRDMRLRNGSWTRNRLAADIGEPPVDGGDDAVFASQRFVVLWSDMADMSKSAIGAAGGPAPAPLSPPDGAKPGAQDDGDQDDDSKPGDGKDPKDPAGPDAKVPKDKAEAFRDAFRGRFREAMARWREVSEDQGAA